MAAYAENRDTANDAALESSPVARYVLQLGELEGTPSDLLAKLDGMATDADRKLKTWPKTPRGCPGRCGDWPPISGRPGRKSRKDTRAGADPSGEPSPLEQRRESSGPSDPSDPSPEMQGFSDPSGADGAGSGAGGAGTGPEADVDLTPYTATVRGRMGPVGPEKCSPVLVPM